MIIDESGLVRAIKAAYKSDGYRVLNHGEQVTIYTDGWYIRCCWDKLPRKVLATIVEHMGIIPDGNNALSIEKDGDPQIVMPDIVGQEISRWTGGSDKGTASLVPVMFQGLQIYQEPDGGQCYGVDPAALAIMERMTAEHTTAIVSDGGSLSWQAGDELVVVGATRKNSYWVKSWERDVWAAMEGVDLHRKEDQE